MLVVALAAVAAGIATYDQYGSKGIVVGTIGSLVAWFVWAYLVWLLGTKLLPEPGDAGRRGPGRCGRPASRPHRGC